MAVYKSSGKAPNKSYYKMICKKIWDFGMLGGMRDGYLLLFSSAPIHSDPLFLIYSVKHTPGKISIQLLQAYSFWLFPTFLTWLENETLYSLNSFEIQAG